MKRSSIFLFHVLFWVSIFAVGLLSMTGTPAVSPHILGKLNIYTRVLTPLFFYIGYFGLLKVKRKERFFLFFLAIFVIVYALLFFISRKAYSYAVLPLSSVFLWMLLGGLFSILIDWFKKRNNLLILEKEHKASELAFMRSQVNPHFLFNTLHNIDTLIYKDQERASKSIEQLSDIMRYMLHESQEERVELKQEVSLLTNYISLEKLRVQNDRFIDFQVSGSVEGVKIAPMLLIPFAENAFKHSVVSDMENGITLYLNIEGTYLHFESHNSFLPESGEKDPTSGIGLETVRKRLNLIYPGAYSLEISENDSIFSVKLEIDLNEN